MRPLKCNDMHESTMNQNKSETNCSQREGERRERRMDRFGLQSDRSM